MLDKFQPPEDKKEALLELPLLRQKTSVREYNNCFNRTAQRATMREAEVDNEGRIIHGYNNRILWAYYLQDLHPEVANIVNAICPHSTTYAEWKRLAADVENTLIYDNKYFNVLQHAQAQQSFHG